MCINPTKEHQHTSKSSARRYRDGAENILVQAVRSEAPIIDNSEKEQVLGSADELLPRENSDPAENRLGEADQPDHRLLAASAELCYQARCSSFSQVASSP